MSPTRPPEAPLARLPNLLSDARPKTTASSTLADASSWSPAGFNARCAVDGNARTPWIAAAEDPAPVLRITMPSSRRANRVRVVPATLFPRAPEFLTRPFAVEIRVNGGPVQPAPFPIAVGGAVELKLEKVLSVQTLELRLVGREVAGKAVGIGEVELRLAPE